MATNTPKLNLIKPDFVDVVDVADLNSNMDILDDAITTAPSVANLSDTDITTPAANELLQYDGSDWVNVGQAEAGAIPVFASAAARGSAIPSPSEGMVTYLSDSDQVTVFDGSSYKPVGGLVDVKSALFTGTQSATVLAGDNVAVTDLSITHAMADASNKLIISAFIGVSANSDQIGQTGIAVDDGTGLIGVGDTAGTSRTAVGAFSRAGGKTNLVVSSNSVTFVHVPGDTTSRTYTVRAVNVEGATRTLFINRGERDDDLSFLGRGASSLVIQEVAV